MSMECEHYNGPNHRTMDGGTTNISSIQSRVVHLTSPFTEFDTQGLELDFTLVGWGTDFILEGGAWNNDRAPQLRTHFRHQRPVHTTKKCLPRVVDACT